MIRDVMAAVGKSINSSDKSHLPLKIETDGLERTECLEAFTKVLQTLICDFLADIGKSTYSFDTRYLQRKVEIDRLQRLESFEILT